MMKNGTGQLCPELKENEIYLSLKSFQETKTWNWQQEL